MRSIIDKMPCMLIITDRMGNILNTNLFVQQFTGKTYEDLCYLRLDHFCTPASCIFLQTHLWPILFQHERLQEVHLQIYDDQKSSAPVLVNCVKEDYEGQEAYFWVFFVMRERSQFESELLKARRETQQMAEALMRANVELSQLQGQLVEKVQKIESENIQLAMLTRVDPLTGLGNRRALEAFIQTYQYEAMSMECVSVLMIDIDHFKKINDQYGHEVGDQVLKAISSQLQNAIQQEDLAIRYGGEEFLILLPHYDRAKADHLAQDIHLRVSGVEFNQILTVSVGIASLHGAVDGDSLCELIANADKAVYRAKFSGRNCTIHYDQ